MPRDTAESTSPDALFAFGRILRPRGTQGELKVQLLCDGPDHFLECIETGRTLAWRERPSATQADAPWPIEIDSVRFHAGFALVRIAGIDSTEEAEPLRNCRLGLERLPEAGDDTFYYHDLEGLEVLSVGGERLGRVLRVQENPAHDMLVVEPYEPGAKPFLLPLVKAFVPRIDLEAGRIEADLPEGLIESQR